MEDACLKLSQTMLVSLVHAKSWKEKSGNLTSWRVGQSFRPSRIVEVEVCRGWAHVEGVQCPACECLLLWQVFAATYKMMFITACLTTVHHDLTCWSTCLGHIILIDIVWTRLHWWCYACGRCLYLMTNPCWAFWRSWSPTGRWWCSSA